MIPTKKQLRKKIKKNKLKLEKKPYFSLVKELIELQNKFLNKTYFELFQLIFEMILYPLYILYQLILGDYSPFYMLSLFKTYELWLDYFRFRELQEEVNSWISIVKQLDGPWISTNDSTYHLYVYADAMERLVVSQKTD
jgi:hypothetical protein